MRSSHKDRILRGVSLCIGFTAPVHPALAALVHPCTSPLNGESLLPRIQLFINICFASMASYFLLLTPQEVTKKEGAPQYRVLRIPSQLHNFLRSRKQDFLSWFRSFEHPCSNDLKIIHLLGTI